MTVTEEEFYQKKSGDKWDQVLDFALERHKKDFLGRHPLSQHIEMAYHKVCGSK